MENDALELEPETPETCASCADVFHAYDATETDDGNVCKECADDYVTTADDHVCHIDNVANCDYCGETYRDRDLTGVINGSHNHAQACESCMSRGHTSFAEPEDEPGIWDTDGLHYSDSRDAYYVNPPSDGLLEHDANVFDFVGGYDGYVNGKRASLRRSKAPVMGVELELDSRDGYDAESIANMINATSFGQYGISKSDATCSGPELVTMPADLFSHKNTFDWSGWSEALREVSKGYHGSDNGMHIHINQDAVSPLTLGKLLVFMNSHKNVAFLNMIAQRDVTEVDWCHINGHFFNKIGKSGKITGQNETPHGKYSIVNVTGQTLEVRMFKSTLLPERILKNLEFCDALVKWCKRASALRLSVDSFIGYVKENRKEYPNLHSFIENRSEA